MNMSAHGNPEDPHSDLGEVISGSSRSSFSRRSAVSLIVVMLMVISAFYAMAAVTGDKAVNGVATPDMVPASLETDVSFSVSEAVEDGSDSLSFHGVRRLLLCGSYSYTRYSRAESIRLCRAALLQRGCPSYLHVFTTREYGAGSYKYYRTSCWSP